MTPCMHEFHCRCLKGWMDIKLQCPTCRSPLPELENEE
jgi:transmembrane E3 ubiquitin-protein ligase